jgi:hypothetical protein
MIQTLSVILLFWTLFAVAVGLSIGRVVQLAEKRWPDIN